MYAIRFVSFVLTAIGSQYLMADIPVPGQKRDPINREEPAEKIENTSVTFRIQMQKDVTKAKLVLPAKQFQNFAPQNKISDRPFRRTEDGSRTFATETIVGGLLLSFAFVSMGIWLSRSRKATGTSLSLFWIAGLLAVSGTASYAYANMGPPPANRSLTNLIFSESVKSWRSAYGEVEIELSDTLDEILLIVPIVAEDEPK
jgi:hypothetical protein